VYRAAQRRPRAIGIIDGFFERAPSVWHKEILWAMAHGVHVFGSASMGALRAAELAPFGMEGVGRIFEAYRDGELQDDDEVAVAHGAAESGYAAASEAMVNIRATLVAARAAGVIGEAARGALERIAKETFYPARAYPLILARACREGVAPAECERLRRWLPGGRIDQKREDALAMLRVMRRRLDAGLAPKRVRYVLERATHWEEMRLTAGALAHDGGTDPAMAMLDGVLDELRLDGAAYAAAYRGALLRLLAGFVAAAYGLTITPDRFQETAEAFRRERGLLDAEDVRRWLERHHLEPDRFQRLLEDEARLRWVERGVAVEVVGALADQLRVDGSYPHLAARARDKRRTLEETGLLHPRLADVGLTEAELRRWYADRQGDHAAGADVADAGHPPGFDADDTFLLAALREYCYARAKAADQCTAAPAAEVRR
jgi:hypothetical protein